MANIASALRPARRRAAQARSQMVFVTTDPARDTAPVLRGYLDRFDPAFDGLTGRPGRDRRARQADGRRHRRRARSSPSGGYDVAHGTQIVGLLPDGTGAVRLDRRAPPRVRLADRPRHDPRATRCPDLVTPLLHPQPRPGRLAPRPAADPRLRAVHHPRRRRRDLAGRAPLGGPRRQPRAGRRHRDLGGAVRPRRRPALPRDHRPGALLRRRRQPGRRRSTSGRAASASGARSRSAASAPGSAAAASGIQLPAARRRAGARASCSPRRSAAGATGSTRSCSAGRPTCPGALEIDPAHRARRATRQYATFHPTFLYESIWDLGVAALVIWADRRFRLGHGRAFALYVDGLHRRPRLDRVPAHRPGEATTSSACGSTTGPRSCCSSAPSAYFVVVGAAPPRPRGVGAPRRRTSPPADETGGTDRGRGEPVLR